RQYSESNDEHDISDDPNNDSYIEITEDNVDTTKEDNNERQKNFDWSSDTTNIEKNTFSAPAMASRKKKKKPTDENEIRASQAYEYLMQKQKESQKKMEKDEYDIYGALVATKLRKIDEITRQYVMNEIDNLMFRAIIHAKHQSQKSTTTSISKYLIKLCTTTLYISISIPNIQLYKTTIYIAISMLNV
ncbi:uncharacterized protein LOC111042769, partial [Myzus persicae]|uniref:uncharacterized protein LOC111042769 n=1 Tax=Myzus persicae TaxID=13164 RepID=UPI000B930A70